MGLTLDRITAYSVTFYIVPGRRFTNDGGKKHNRHFRRSWVGSSVSSKGWLRSAVIQKRQNCQKVLPYVPQSRHASLVGGSFDGFMSGLLVSWLTGEDCLAWV